MDLDRLTETLEAQTAAIKELAASIRGQKRVSRLVIALVVLNLIGVSSAGVAIYQNNNAAQERARVATEQRKVQLEILRQLEARR